MTTYMPNGKEKLEIQYPCVWQYTVIGCSHQKIKTAISDICSPIPVNLNYSHSSSGEKYHSYNAAIEVHDDEARLSLFNALQNHPDIKFVI